MLAARRRWLGPFGWWVAFAASLSGCGGSSPHPGVSHAGGASVAAASVAAGARERSASGSTGVARIAAGGFAGYALLADGRVWGWGDDLEGQIGRGARAQEFSSTPVAIPGVAGVRAIAGGGNTAYALRRGGDVWAWGDDSQDELGDSGISPREIPMRVGAPGGIVAIAGGAYSAYALRSDGSVWAWGDDSVGQLGTAGAEVTRGKPRPVQELAGVVAIAAGAGDAYALRRDGTVWAWGDDSLGQLGTGGCIASQATAHDGAPCPATGVPVQIRGLSGVVAIAAGANTGYALGRDGTVWAWGDNSFGALGGRAGDPFVDRPVPVSGLRNVVRIAAGADSAYAVLRDGAVWAWGRGVDGELGNGSFSDQAVPSRVLDLTGVVSVAGGGAMAYALDRSGELWAWGSGFYGQLGNGSRISLDRPTLVLRLSGIPAAL
jgi:alpha-tubulin suppressor-like RCC1 family protein